jgi:hypothetical protein
MISTWYLGVKCFREPHIVVAVLGVVELNGILQVTLRRIHDVKIAIGIVNSDDDHVVTVFELVYEVFGEGTTACRPTRITCLLLYWGKFVQIFEIYPTHRLTLYHWCPRHDFKRASYLGTLGRGGSPRPRRAQSRPHRYAKALRARRVAALLG